MYVLITGANRGIGLALTQVYLDRAPATVFAACREPGRAGELAALGEQVGGRLVIVPLDVRSAEQIAEAVKQVEAVAGRLDVLINNAGINMIGQTLHTINRQRMMDIYEVNAVAPLMIAQAFADLLARGQTARLVNLSSEMGSVSLRDYGGSYAYCASKAALNMTTRGLAYDLAGQGVTTIALDPGWVKTEMGGEGAMLTPEESATGILNVIAGLTPEDNGRYLAFDGSEHPW